MIQLAVNLEFSESLDEFRYQVFQPVNEGDFRTIVEDISYPVAQMFVVDVRERFPNPMLYVSVICMWNAYKLKNNL